MNAKFAVFLAVLAVGVAAVGVAQAGTYGTVTAYYNGYYYGQTATINVTGGDSGATVVGMYKLRSTASDSAYVDANVNFPVFCVDTFHNINSGESVTFDVEDLATAPGIDGDPDTPSPMGVTKANLIKELYARYRGYRTTNDGAAALGAAIWEIVDEPVHTWDLTDGVFKISGLTAQASTYANTWLASLSADGALYADYDIKALISTNPAKRQDFAIVPPGGYVPPVPEPLTMLGVFMGVCAVGAYVRRRTRTTA
ncbi:MAG: PEP-CTERM sorting domain-containing protein [Phycisphaerae bacterium]